MGAVEEVEAAGEGQRFVAPAAVGKRDVPGGVQRLRFGREEDGLLTRRGAVVTAVGEEGVTTAPRRVSRSEEHTSELQSLMRISYAVFCLKKKKITTTHPSHIYNHHNII